MKTIIRKARQDANVSVEQEIMETRNEIKRSDRGKSVELIKLETKMNVFIRIQNLFVSKHQMQFTVDELKDLKKFSYHRKSNGNFTITYLGESK